MCPIFVEQFRFLDARAINLRTIDTPCEFVTLVLSASIKAELIAVLTFGAHIVTTQIPRRKVEAVCHCAILIRETHLNTLRNAT